MNNHLKSILKVCGIVGLICLVTVLSCLPFVNFDNNKAELHADLRPCDSVVSDNVFTSNTWLIPISYSRTAGINYTFDYGFCSVQTRFTISGSNLNFNLLFPYLYSSDNSESLGVSYPGWPEYYQCAIDSTWYNMDINLFSYTLNNVTTNHYSRIWYKCDAGFNADIVRITIASSTGINGNIYGTSFSFIDNNEKSFTFQIGFNKVHDELLYAVPARTYYLNTELTDNQYYNAGYSDGQSNGLLSSQQNYYDNGYQAGKTDGYADGYRDGLDEQDIYTFGNLLTAVVDAPVGVFVSMLDFNIMGFNLLNLVVGLLTLAVICLVVKLILGGK